MWTISKRFRFEAAHRLPHHDGKCQRLHGHSWQGEIVLRGDSLNTTGPKKGMVVDFNTIKEVMRPLLEHHLDHHHLNETLGMENPTSEEIARWIFVRLRGALPGLVAVVIEETCTSRAEYRDA
jgi:6-pyruvoyltetrahydropterin/6-carboxytetrahydropterin synthase